MKKYGNLIENYFLNLTVKSKIITGFSIALFLVFCFSLIIMRTNYEMSKTQKITEYSLRTINRMQNARLDEKDFFLTGKLEFVENNRKNIELTKNSLNMILKTDNNSELKSKVEILLKYLDYYDDNFLKVVNITKEKGLTSNEGYLREIKDSYELIFKNLKPDDYKTMNILMKLDKSTNAYFENKNPDIINSISNDIANIQELLKIGDYEEETQKNLDIYRKSFYKILSVDVRINDTITEFQEYI
nr:hypothetical protein [Spirochaetota bacterium]